MSKDPAILWYWNDWQGGTATLSRHLKGCYMDLLSAQFNSGPLSIDQIKSVLGTDKALWDILSKKFRKEVNSDGIEVFFNERMATEVIKRKAFTDSRKNNLSKIKNKSPHMGHHMAGHMENENENENLDKDRGVGKGEDLWTDAKNSFLNSTDAWVMKFCTEKKVNENRLKTLMQEFITDQELKEEFKSFKELRNHFTNWFNQKSKQYNGNSVQKAGKATGKDAGANELLEDLRANS